MKVRFASALLAVCLLGGVAFAGAPAKPVGRINLSATRVSPPTSMLDRHSMRSIHHDALTALSEQAQSLMHTQVGATRYDLKIGTVKQGVTVVPGSSNHHLTVSAKGQAVYYKDAPAVPAAE